MVKVARTERGDPEIEQRQVAQHSIEEFGSEGPIGGCELARTQDSAQDRVGKSVVGGPFAKGSQRELSSRLVPHD
jgi:hypothetical protein